MKSYYPTSTPYLTFYVKDRDGALVDPTTSITVTVYDPNGTAVLTDSAASKISVGYYYNASYATTTSSLTGVYTWIPKSTDGTIITRNQKFYFALEKETGY